MDCPLFPIGLHHIACSDGAIALSNSLQAEAYMYVDLIDQNDDFCKQCTYPVGNKCSVCVDEMVTALFSRYSGRRRV